MTAQAAPPAPEDEIPEERQFLGVPVRNAHRKNRANLTAELLAVARSLIKGGRPVPLKTRRRCRRDRRHSKR